MKHKYKKFLLLATLLILALCMGALGVYHGVILPNSSELQTKRALKQLERVVTGSSRESFEKTLALMDDETLLCAIAEASLEAEEQGSSTQLAFFAPAAVQRIGPKVTPAQLELLLRDEQYPAGFRSFMLEVTLYANGEEANGMILPSAAYTNMLKELIAEDGIEDDVLLEYALIAVPWEEDSEILQKIYEQRTDNPVLRRRAMELMAQYDPERAQEQLFSLVNNNSWIGLDMQTLKGYYASLVTINTPQARQEAQNTLKSMIAQKDKVHGRVLYTAITQTGFMMGLTHTGGFPLLMMEHYDALLTVPELELEGALVYLTNYLFWEIDELLRSDEPEVVEWALYLAELVPFQYYIDSLEMVAKRDDELAQKALELISRANQELIYLPRADLATKEGDWEALNEQNRLELNRRAAEIIAALEQQEKEGT